MTEIIKPCKLSGAVCAPASKSHLQRALICAALSDGESQIELCSLCDDTVKLIECLKNLCEIEISDKIYVRPKSELPKKCVMDCGDSAANLRFLLPVMCALGIETVFPLSEGLRQRPIQRLLYALREGGAYIERNDDYIYCGGKLYKSIYHIPGFFSSQYISGMLFALSFLDYPSELIIDGIFVSRAYIRMTIDMLNRFGGNIEWNKKIFSVRGMGRLHAQRNVEIEGDWSNGAFFLCLGALSEDGITVRGLSGDAIQGDKAVIDALRSIGANTELLPNGDVFTSKNELKAFEFDAMTNPDLVMPLAFLAFFCNGVSVIDSVERLKTKESDRLSGLLNLAEKFKIKAWNGDDRLYIEGGTPVGGFTYASNDHRMTMTAACAGIMTDEGITIENAEAVNKSYPEFFEALKQLEVK